VTFHLWCVVVELVIDSSTLYKSVLGCPRPDQSRQQALGKRYFVRPRTTSGVQIGFLFGIV
jgi:hypothetical protein